MKDGSSQKNCILIVDDDFINRELLKNIFSAQFEFEEAENGKAGYEQIIKHKDRLCALILDVQMPIMSGIELLEKINEEGITEEIPIFLITAQGDEELVSLAYHLGVMDVITKPVTPIVIEKRVKTVIELFSAREELSRTVEGQNEKLSKHAKEIDELNKGTIEALATAIEFRDIESGQHVSRIYGITKYILSKTEFGKGLSGDEIESIARGAIMHDVGKIAISDIILNKPAKLTKEEFEIMKQHTTKGYELLLQISQSQLHSAYKYAADIARHHHERWDGSGYPDGLRGDEISVAAQVVSIVDVYDALVSVRVYKKAYTPDEAVRMIKDGECGVFNPKLVDCFLGAEPVFRKWYTGETPDEELSSVTADAKRINDLYSVAATSPAAVTADSVTNVMLLMTALQSAYDLIIAVNLTKNSFYIIDDGRYRTHYTASSGIFDELVEEGAAAVPTSHKKEFYETFCRANLISAYESGKKSVTLEHPEYSDDGSLHFVNSTVLFVKDGRSGDLMQIILSQYIDKEIAEREKAQKILTEALNLAEQANQTKYSFLSKMSHDIRTPLNAIIGMTTIISAHLDNRDKVDECLVKIGQSSKQLLGIVNDILDYTKIESGSISLSVSDFVFREFIAELATEYGPLAKSKHQSFKVTVDDKVGASYVGDEFRIRQVLANLIDNAIRYTDEGGDISLTVDISHAAEEHDSLTFTVRDNGVGIKPEFLPSIFEPFTQDKNNHAGTSIGLGLAISQNLVHLMNGEITAESEVGVGSVFTAEIPLERGSLSVSDDSVNTDINVLVVDDEAAVCEETAILLGRMGIRAETADSGAMAIELVRTRRGTADEFDVAIVDWQMPNMDGVETVRRIRREVGDHVLVVIMSAYDWTEIKDEARAAGVDLFIAKPINENTLRTAISCSDRLRSKQQNISFNGERVLVAEDNAFNAEVAKAILEMKNLKVDIAINGKEAYDKFTASGEGEYLAVLMDIIMPVMNGHEAARAIRASSHPEALSIPIYAMTANAFRNDILEAKLAGMNGHIAKPVDFDEVARILHKFVKNKQSANCTTGGVRDY